MPIATGVYNILNREVEPADFLENFLNDLGR